MSGDERAAAEYLANRVAWLELQYALTIAQRDRYLHRLIDLGDLKPNQITADGDVVAAPPEG